MPFLWWLARRIAYAIALLAAVAVLNFGLMHLAPGDIVQTIVGEMGGASEETIAQLTRAYGLDQSFPRQLWLYVSRVATGDLGHSFYFNQPALGLILDRVPATVLLVTCALVIAILLGTFLGVMAARYPSSWLGALVTIVSLFGFSAPVFWSGLMLLLLFASLLPILPASGMYDVALGATGLGFALDVAHHLILPSMTLAIIYR